MTSKTAPMHGLIAFAVTPLKPDESIDEERLLAHVDALIEGGVDGITLFGSTGAIGSFSEVERRRVVEIVLPYVGGRVPVMVGTGAISTTEAVRLSQHAQEYGASAALVVPITYWLLGEAELLAHYKTINDSISIPMAIYNSPRLTGIDLMPPLIARIAELSNVRYLKESSPDLLRIAQVKRLTDGRLKVFAGRDDSVLEAFQVGADAWASGCANFMPSTCKRLLSLLGKPEASAEARTLEASLRPVTEFGMAKGLVRTCHDALRILGRPVGNPRKPIQTLSQPDFSQWSEILRTHGSVMK
ncbi:dihydrodipicolinate synthase family protein [Variovorax sp. VNK109]|uniref:dihydrodipicolinate synthase family protein n=1 Tax=Variovorax sp. VNK109 TaxID=3400919 RepID=UPI003BFC781E